jgi:hypothetical protein
MYAFMNRPRKNDRFIDTCQVVCVFGPVGCGKTTWLHANVDFIEIDEDVLKSKDGALDFIDRVKNLKRNILIDNFDGLLNRPGASLFLKPVSKSSTILVSTKNIEGTTPFEMSGPDRRQQSIGFHNKDVIHDPINVMKTYMSTKMPSKLPLLDIISAEHGNVMVFVHENYISDTMTHDTINHIIQSLSDAALFDSKMYDGEWYLMSYFLTTGCVLPNLYIDGNVKIFKPASLWTKFMSTCMHQKLFKATRLTIDEVDFHSRVLHDKSVSKFYNFRKIKSKKV